MPNRCNQRMRCNPSWYLLLLAMHASLPHHVSPADVYMFPVAGVAV